MFEPDVEIDAGLFCKECDLDRSGHRHRDATGWVKISDVKNPHRSPAGDGPIDQVFARRQ
jgi:hypothetical protein